MDMAIKDLRSAAAVINEVANTLAEMFSGDVGETRDENAPSLEKVRAVLADKSRKGHTAEIRALLQKYGADRLSDITPENYKVLLDDAEVL